MQKLYGQYFIHVRCLDSLRAQTNANARNIQPISDAVKSGSAPQSMILLPDGLLDLSDEQSNDGDDLGDDHSDLKIKRTQDTNKEIADIPKEIENRAKLRIKTGGSLLLKHSKIGRKNLFFFL